MPRVPSTPAKPHMSESVQNQALAFKEAGLSNREICNKLGLGIRALQRFFKRQGPGVLLTPRAPRPDKGTRKLLTPGDLRFLKQVSVKNPKWSANDIRRENPTMFGDLQPRYLQKMLKDELGMPSRQAAKKPNLTAFQTDRRLKFCKRYLHWTTEHWNCVLYTDESQFQTIRNSGCRVRRPLGTSRHNPKYTVKNVKHPGASMAWGCFSAQGAGPLFWLAKGEMMNQHNYADVLRNYAFPTMNSDLHDCEMLLQDGAPCHTAKSVLKLIKDQDPRIRSLPWPGHSPDLNPIENAWNQIKNTIASQNTITVPLLQAAVEKCWAEMDPAYWKNLSDSMPRRLQACIDAKGQMTKY